MRKLHKRKVLETKITIPVVAIANLFIDENGKRSAEIEYNHEALQEIITKALLPKFEKIVGFKQYRNKEGEANIGSCTMVGFMSSMRDSDYEF